MRKRTLFLLAALACASLACATALAASTPPQLDTHPVSGTVAAPPPMTPEDKALAAVEESGRQVVAVLLARMQRETDPAALQSLERQIESAKLAQRLEFLRTKARFATARGDAATAQDAQHMIDLMLHPVVPPAVAVPSGPDKGAPAKGGER